MPLGHLPLSAESPPTPAPPSSQLYFLPSPHGTALFLSPRQHGRERAQPRKSRAPPDKVVLLLWEGWLLPGGSPSPQCPGDQQTVGVLAQWVPRVPSADSWSLVQRSHRQKQLLLTSVESESLGIPQAWELRDAKEQQPPSLSGGPASLDLTGHLPAGDSGLPTAHLLCGPWGCK